MEQASGTTEGNLGTGIIHASFNDNIEKLPKSKYNEIRYIQHT
jgi:hypothetical protein